MARLPKLYPDLWLPRLGYLLADLAAFIWACVWLYIGYILYSAVMTLSVIADGVIAAGQKINDAVTQVQQAVNNLPLVGPGLRNDLAPLHGVPQSLIDAGYNGLHAIQHLALLIGLVAAGVPLLALALNYLPWRVRKSRGFRSLDRMLRKPGAGAVSSTMHLLAARALYTLPYDDLLRYSADPLGEWREGRYYNLARATMTREGLDLRRYLRRMEDLAPLTHAPGLPTNRTG